VIKTINEEHFKDGSGITDNMINNFKNLENPSSSYNEMIPLAVRAWFARS
jgi:hypothetical protein